MADDDAVDDGADDGADGLTGGIGGATGITAGGSAAATASVVAAVLAWASGALGDLTGDIFDVLDYINDDCCLSEPESKEDQGTRCWVREDGRRCPGRGSNPLNLNFGTGLEEIEVRLGRGCI